MDSASEESKKSTGISSLLFLPLIFIYFELLLRAFGSDIRAWECVYSCVFAASAGLITGGIFSLLPPKWGKVCTAVVLAAAGTAFTAECLVKKNFQAYMPPSSIFSGASNVIGNYGSELVSAILAGIPQIVLFYAPVIIYALFGNKHALVPKERVKPVFSAVFALCGALLFGGGIYLANSGDSSDIYKLRDNFDSSAGSFGLLTALRLDIAGQSVTEEEETGFVAVNAQMLTSAVQTEETYTAVIEAETTVTASAETGLETAAFPENAVTSAVENDEAQTAAAEIQKFETAAGETLSAEIQKSETTTGETLPSQTSAPQTSASKTETAVSSVTEKKQLPVPVEGYNMMEIDFDRAYSRCPTSVVAELNNYVQSLEPSEKNAYTGLFKGKNLILICAEAFSDAAIDKDLTPTLYRLANNGIYFSNYYQPTWGGSTTTGEFSFVTGLVPRSGLESMQIIQDNNNFFTLGNQLKRQGYASCAFHNGKSDYYSRDLTHPSLGYDKFLGFGNGLENIIRSYSEDSVMLDKTVDEYIDKQPFSLYYMTVSGHFSYKADNVKVKENLPKVTEVYGNKYKTVTNYYLCYQMELEKALNLLVSKLEAAGIANDTVICLTADHYPYGLEQSYGNAEDYLSDLYGYKYSESWEKDRNAWILWSGCLENGYRDYACEISSPTYSLDIVPTLSNLFGVDYDSRLLVGRDVFSSAPAIVLWNNYSWLTDQGSYNARTKVFTPAEGSGCGKEYADVISGIVRNKVYFSYQTADNDYYGVLFDQSG